MAINVLGTKYYYGSNGLRKNVQRAVELWTEAAELRSVDALFNLGYAYDFAEWVQEDRTKAV